jgi:hypothetical protein
LKRNYISVYSLSLRFLNRICSAPTNHGVRYAVVGGHAAALHGVVRGTVETLDGPVKILARKQLIETKRMSDRPQDLEDIKALEKLP